MRTRGLLNPSRRRYGAAAWLLAAGAGVLPARAQTPAAGVLSMLELPALAGLPPVSLARSYEWRGAGAGGRQDRLLIALPSGPAPVGGHALLVLLDGDVLFPLMHALMQHAAARPDGAQWHWPVLLGLGQGQGEGYDQASREADFPPGPGADALLDRLAQHWLPWLGQQLPLNPQQRTLFGHSFGGLFTLYALMRRPGLFRHYVAASPSIWWGQQALLPWRDAALAQAAKAHGAANAATVRHSNLSPWPTQAPPSVWIGAGSREEDGSDADPQRRQRQQQRRQVSAARELAASLHAWPGLSVNFELLAGLDHGGVVLPSLQQALLQARLAVVSHPSDKKSGPESTP